MTVNISKPAINVREKLSSLERKEGLTGLQVLAADTASEAVDALNLEDHTFVTFNSTGIDDNATSTKLTVSDAGISLGDNDKAIFGAGSDLQIYHDGADSYVRDAGAGNLYLQGDASVRVRSSDGTLTSALFTPSGLARLSYAGAAKLETTSTGIDVTGTVTADGLTVNKGSDGADIVSLTGASAGRYLNVQSFTNSGAAGAGYDFNATSGQGAIRLSTTSLPRLFVADNGDISFYEDTGTTPKFFWDASAEALGIGTTSPGKALHVNSGTGNIGIRVESSDATASIEFMDSGTTSTLTSARVGGISDDFFVQTNGSERMRIDSSGNVGIGTSSPSEKLTLFNGSSQTTLKVASDLNFSGAYLGTATSDNRGASLQLLTHTNATNAAGWRLAVARDLFGGTSDLVFSHAGGTTSYGGLSYTERMRIDSSGNVLVGVTSVNDPDNGNGGGVFDVSSFGARTLKLGHTDTSATYRTMVEFHSGTGTGRVGYIACNATSTSYSTSSDYRLKEDVQPMTGASQRVLALNPVNFQWKADGTRVDGFLAHEAQAVVPEAVTGTKDAVDDEGNPEYQGIDQSKLVPLLTAALQEALGEIESLKARVTALEAQP